MAPSPSRILLSCKKWENAVKASIRDHDGFFHISTAAFSSYRSHRRMETSNWSLPLECFCHMDEVLHEDYFIHSSRDEEGDIMFSFDLKMPTLKSRPFFHFSLKGVIYQFQALALDFWQHLQVFNRVSTVVLTWAQWKGVCIFDTWTIGWWLPTQSLVWYNIKDLYSDSAKILRFW